MAIKGERRRLGFSGERKAAAWLKREGYKIVARNWRCRAGEADIIAENDEVVAFVEVKTRTNDNYGEPCEAVDSRRQTRYKNIARYYFYGREPQKTVRFDIVEVTPEGVNHIENAFY